MKRKELAVILSGVAPTTYYEWSGKQSVPKPPFLAYLDEPEDSRPADNRAFVRKPRYRVELYTAKGDDETEELLEAAFDEVGIYFDKLGREWLDKEEWYMTVYYI